ncbi:hypothetical protein MHU86_7818 [Fragilaria crotonensis]|nr:hypothetical protein MHU86_7818 [Fragilaria crotonensis]
MEVERRRRQAASSVEWQLQRQDNISPPNDVDCGLLDDVKSRRLLYGSFGNKTLPTKSTAIAGQARCRQAVSSAIWQLRRQDAPSPPNNVDSARKMTSSCVVCYMAVSATRATPNEKLAISRCRRSCCCPSRSSSQSFVGRYSELNALSAVVTVVWQ